MISKLQNDHEDHIYFNIEINSDNSINKTEAKYNITRTRDILDVPSNYYLSVVRFNIPSFFLPLAIFQKSATNDDEGVYSVSMDVIDLADNNNVLATAGPTNLIYIPSVENISKGDSEYYFMYNYQILADMINVAMQTCFNAVKVTIPDNTKFAPPVVNFDAVSQKFVWQFQSIWVENDMVVEEVDYDTMFRLYVNDPLWTLIYGLNHTRINNTINFSATGQDILIEPIILFDNITQKESLESVLSEDNYYNITSEYITLYNWNPFKKIILTSGNIPCRSEYVKGSGDSYQKIITDFIPSNNITDQRSVFQYNAGNNLRLVDLTSNSPLRNIDIKIWWEDVNQNLNPLYLPWNSQANIKLAFYKKSLFNNKDGRNEATNNNSKGSTGHVTILNKTDMGHVKKNKGGRWRKHY